MSNVNHDTVSIINALIAFFRKNDLRMHNELANDTNIYTGTLRSEDAKQNATLVFIGEYVVLSLLDVGSDLLYIGNVHVFSTPVAHNVENYQRIAFKKSTANKTGSFYVDPETCGQRVLEAVTKLNGYTVQEIMDYCIIDELCQKAVQNLIRVGFITPERILKVIDGQLRRALKMLPYKDFVYVATHDMTNVAISRQKNMAKDMSQAKMIAFQAGAK